MSDALEPFRSLLERALPISLPGARLSLGAVDAVPVRCEGDAVHAVLRLVLLDGDLIVDVYEHEVKLANLSRATTGRWLALIEANLRVLPELAAWGFVPASLPVEFFPYFHALLCDDRLQTADDFAAVLGDRARVEALLEQAADEEWRTRLAGTALADRPRAVRDLGRPTIRLGLESIETDDASDPADDEDTPTPDDGPAVGASRVGGTPDLPPALAWPTARGEPYVFLAQLDLASLAPLEAARELPGRGWLSFFYHPGGTSDDGLVPVRVLHFSGDESLARRDPPAGVTVLREHLVTPRPEWRWPGTASPFYEALVDEDRVLAYHRACRAPGGHPDPTALDPLPNLETILWGAGAWDTERPVHRLLGYAANIQGDPYLSAEIATLPAGWAAYTEGTPEALAIHRAARRWRLLLQIDASGDGAPLLDQDGGFFYVWMTEDALARHAWDEAIGTQQQH